MSLWSLDVSESGGVRTGFYDLLELVPTLGPDLRSPLEVDAAAA